jgi:hypothetical protein
MITALALSALLSPAAFTGPAVARHTEGPKKVGRVTHEHGRIRLHPLPVDDDKGIRIEVVEQGFAPLANPDARGIFVGKLKRGRKAKLTAAKPADKGVAMVAMGGLSVPLYIGLAEPGFHLLDGPGAAIVFAPGVMGGDDILVACEGELPAKVSVRILHATATKWEDVQHELDGTTGKIQFAVPTAEMTDGVVMASMGAASGKGRIEKCTVRRVLP